MSLSRSEPGPFPSARAERSDFRLGPHRVSPSVNRVVTPAGAVQLEPKIMQVLVCLAEAAGSTVSKQKLFDEVWEGVHVTEDALTRAIGELRRALGDDPAHPIYIETIRKTGYRLITLPAPASNDPATPAAPPTSSESKRASLRVPLLAFAAIAVALALAAAVLLRGLARSASSSPMRVRTLTALAGATRDPAVSPAGTRVAFAWNGGAGDEFSLYVQLVDAESPLRVTKTPGVEDRLPAWSPDGQWLAFTRVTPRRCEVVL